MFLPLNGRLSASTRGQLWLAAVPLAVMVIARAMGELEVLITDRVAELGRLDAAIAEGRARLAARTVWTPAAPTETPDPDQAEAAEVPESNGRAKFWTGDVPADAEHCHYCDLIAESRTPSGVPVCNLHDPAVRLVPEP